MIKIKSKETVLAGIIGIAISIGILVCFGAFDTEKKPELPEFCLTTNSTYLLLCSIGNQTISAISTQENLKIVLEKNNCSIEGRHDALDLIYCNQETNLTKYKLLIQPFKSPN